MADIRHLRGRSGSGTGRGEVPPRLSRVPVILLKIPRQTAVNDNPTPWARRLAQAGLSLLLAAALASWLVGLPTLP